MANRNESFGAGRGANGAPVQATRDNEGNYFHPTTGASLPKDFSAPEWSGVTPPANRATDTRTDSTKLDGKSSKVVSSSTLPSSGAAIVEHPDFPGKTLKINILRDRVTLPHVTTDYEGNERNLTDAQKAENDLHERAWTGHLKKTILNAGEEARSANIQAHQGDFAKAWSASNKRRTVRVNDGSRASLYADKPETEPSVVESRLSALTAAGGGMSPKPRDVAQKLGENLAILNDHYTSGLALGAKQGLSADHPFAQRLMSARAHLDSATRALAERKSGEAARRGGIKGAPGPDQLHGLLHKAAMSIGAAHDELSHPDVAENIGLPGTNAKDLNSIAVNTHAYANYKPFLAEGKAPKKVKLGHGETATLPSGRVVSRTVVPKEVAGKVAAAQEAQKLGLITGVEQEAVDKLTKKTPRIRKSMRNLNVVESAGRGGVGNAPYVKDESGKNLTAGEISGYKAGEDPRAGNTTPSSGTGVSTVDFTDPSKESPYKKPKGKK